MEEITLEVLVNGGFEEQRASLSEIRKLGSGRASDVYLVEVGGKPYAEKRFNPKKRKDRFLRDFIYECCFQSDFPYQHSRDAIEAAFLRRKVLGVLTQYWCGYSAIADAEYIRHDGETWILGTEYIDGRGARTTEMRSLCDFLDSLSLYSQLVGITEWQEDRKTLVATANALKRKEDGRWVLADAESAIAHLTRLHYLKRGVLFDDLSPKKLKQYVDENRETAASYVRGSMVEELGEQKVQELETYVGLFIQKMRDWKDSEIAIFRNPNLSSFYQAGKRLASKIASASRYSYRFLMDKDFLDGLKRERSKQWLEEGRITAEAADDIVNSFDNCFYASNFLSYCVEPPLHRFLTDIEHRKGVYTNAIDFLMNPEKRKEFVAQYIDSRIDSWLEDKRIEAEDASQLKEAALSDEIQEHIRGFGWHLVIWLAASPPFAADAGLASLGAYLKDWKPLGPIFIAPGFRTLYSLSHLYNTNLRREKILRFPDGCMIMERDVANTPILLAGAVPKLGTGAYIIGILDEEPELGKFLARDLASILGQKTPVFGTKYGLLEHWYMCVSDKTSNCLIAYHGWRNRKEGQRLDRFKKSLGDFDMPLLQQEYCSTQYPSLRTVDLNEFTYPRCLYELIRNSGSA